MMVIETDGEQLAPGSKVGGDGTSMLLEGLPLKRPPVRTNLATLSYYSVVAESPSALDCPACRKRLDVYQPDLDRPGHFLGTCPECGRWYRAESIHDDGQVTVLQIPDLSDLDGPTIPPSDKT